MNVQVEYTAQLRTCVGGREETIGCPEGGDVAGLLAAIADRHGDAVRDMLWGQDGKPATTILCFVADEQVDAGHLLADGDRLTLMSPIAGG